MLLLRDLLLLELQGVKRFYETTLQDMLAEVAANLECKLFSGEFAYVLAHPDWDYVYKVWYRDDPYDEYVAWVTRHQRDPHVPKVRKRLVKLGAFNLRPDEGSFDVLKVLKIEKLETVTAHNTTLEQWLAHRYLYGDYKTAKDVIKALNHDGPPRVDLGHRAYDRLFGYDHSALNHDGTVSLDDLFKRFPDAEDFFYTLADFSRQLKNGTIDMHELNVMLRPSDGTFVITDPAYDQGWHKEQQKFKRGYKQISGRSRSSGSSVFKTTTGLERASSSLAF